jgi:hypothetical protein
MRSLMALSVLAFPALAGQQGSWGYWGYSYEQIDVTAFGTREYAINLAHQCHRLDGLLREILAITSQERPPVHIYALDAEHMRRVGGSSGTASFAEGKNEFTVRFESSQTDNYWSAYYGYIGALLASDRQLEGRPDWYSIGVPMAFADVRFEGVNKVRIGSINQGLAYTLAREAPLIPMRKFLSIKRRDAALAGKSTLYQSEAWYLAREIYLEGIHRAEFNHYLELMSGGTSEPEAFAASFKITYEQLDKELLEIRPAHAYILRAPTEDHVDPTGAQRLSTAEVAGRLALLSLTYHHNADALQLAKEALAQQPDNATALRAVALAQAAAAEKP